MTSSECPDTGGPEHMAETPAMIQQWCLGEVRRGSTELRTSLTNGTFKEAGCDAVASARLISEVAADFAQTGDLTAAERDIDLLLRIPDTLDYTLVRTCYAVAGAGSRYAFDVLRDKLGAEKFAVLEHARRQRESNPQPYPNIASFALDEVVRACEEADMPPDGWIDEYAIDPAHRWSVYAEHYGRLGRTGRASNHAQQRHISEMIDDPATDPAFIFDKTLTLFIQTENQPLRERLMERYKAIAGVMPLTPATFIRHVRTGQEVIKDAALSTSENISFFEQTINASVEALREAGADTVSLAETQILWQLQLLRYRGVEAPQLITYLNTQISQTLAADIPDSAHASQDLDAMIRNRESIVYRRDIYLNYIALRSIEANQFADARSLLAEVADEKIQISLLRECLTHADNQEQIQALRLDDMTLQIRPESNEQFRVAEAIIGQDAAAIAGLAIELAETAEREDGHSARLNIKRLYESLADGPAVLEAARDILAALRRSGAALEATDLYSRALIKAGDEAEPAQARNDIMQRVADPAKRLVKLRRLAQLLAE